MSTLDELKRQETTLLLKKAELDAELLKVKAEKNKVLLLERKEFNDRAFANICVVSSNPIHPTTQQDTNMDYEEGYYWVLLKDNKLPTVGFYELVPRTPWPWTVVGSDEVFECEDIKVIGKCL